MDKYPFVRYSYGGNERGFNLLAASGYGRASSGRGEMRSYMNPAPLRLSGIVQPSWASRTEYGPSSYNPTLPRTYGGRLQLDGAVDLYKNRCMTVGTLSKYWLSGGAPSSFVSRRQRDAALNFVSPSYSTASSRYAASSYSFPSSSRRYYRF